MPALSRLAWTSILFCALGVLPLWAALLALRRHPLAPHAAFAVGAALLIWMAVEVAIVGYTNHPPQSGDPVFLVSWFPHSFCF